MKNNFNAFFIYANNSYIFPSIISCYIHTASTFDLFSYILHTHVIVHETDFMGTFMQNSLFHSHFMNKITSSARCSQKRDGKCFRIYFILQETFKLYLQPVFILFDLLANVHPKAFVKIFEELIRPLLRS